MSRYGDNCEDHDMPVGNCIECVRSELRGTEAERDRYKAALKRLKYDWPSEGQTVSEYAGHVVDVAEDALAEAVRG